MSNDKFECTKPGECIFDFCIIKTQKGFKKCRFLEISSDINDEKRG
ncbi:MAG: hypothetical protein KAS66_07460 [Candidatus Omnitrophica bacterium]|nr:hypothetical protein [Candidatus Omnitrophota bacterium]